MSSATPIECLDIFDEFELDSMRQRRLAIYALEDYYGTVLVEVGQEYLGLKPDDIDKSIKTLWNISKQRLQLLSDIEVPEKYNRILYKLSDERNSVAHNYHKNPERKTLIESRKNAEDFAEWMKNIGRKYENEQEKLTPEDSLVNIARDMLYSIQSPIDKFHNKDLKEEQDLINRWVDTKLDDLEQRRFATRPGDSNKSEGISKSHIHFLNDVFEMKKTKMDMEAKNDRHSLELSANNEKEYTKFVIIDEFDEETGEICVVSDNSFMGDTLYQLNLYHPDTPADVQGELKGMKSNSQIRLKLLTDSAGEKYVAGMQ